MMCFLASFEMCSCLDYFTYYSFIFSKAHVYYFYDSSFYSMILLSYMLLFNWISHFNLTDTLVLRKKYSCPKLFHLPLGYGGFYSLSYQAHPNCLSFQIQIGMPNHSWHSRRNSSQSFTHYSMWAIGITLFWKVVHSYVF